MANVEDNGKITMAVLYERVGNLINSFEEFCEDDKIWKREHEKEHRTIWYKVGIISGILVVIASVARAFFKI